MDSGKEESKREVKENTGSRGRGSVHPFSLEKSPASAGSGVQMERGNEGASQTTSGPRPGGWGVHLPCGDPLPASAVAPAVGRAEAMS